MTLPIADAVRAMRASEIEPQSAGLWYIERADESRLSNPGARAYLRRHGGFDRYPDMAGVVTSLCRWTDATIHRGAGECVMSDDPRELQRHLPIVLAASGRVLVTGLGLGCVVRGLLANQAVTHIDVIEIDRDVLDMVAPSFAGRDRLTIHTGDALSHAWPAGTRWDYAWHDIWSEEPSTQILHAHLLARYRPLAAKQGAWGFPRQFKRVLSWPLIGGQARRRTA